MLVLTFQFRHIGSVLLKIVYGYDTLEEQDPMIALIQQGFSCVEEATSSGHAIELFPWRKCSGKYPRFPATDKSCTSPVRYIPSWFPYADFKRSALNWRQDYERMREIPFEYAEKNMVHICNLATSV